MIPVMLLGKPLYILNKRRKRRWTIDDDAGDENYDTGDVDDYDDTGDDDETEDAKEWVQ